MKKLILVLMLMMAGCGGKISKNLIEKCNLICKETGVMEVRSSESSEECWCQRKP